MPSETNLPIIQVCGDPTIDWLSLRNNDFIERGGVYFWTSDFAIPTVSLGSQAGGSALLLEMVRKVAGSRAAVDGAEPKPHLLKEPANTSITNAWTAWKAYVDKGSNKPVFRLNEWQGCQQGRWDYEENRLTGSADLLVIEDSGLEFRQVEAGWPEALTPQGTSPECIIMKLAKFGSGGRENATAGNPLLDRICELGLGGKTIAVAALSDLRACAVKIGASLSWESLFEEIVHAVYSPECPFTRYDEASKSRKLIFSRVIVTVGTGGAVVVEDGGDALVFDRTGQEDDFSNRHDGEMMGLNTCVIGALVAHWLDKQGVVDWVEAARDGVGLSRFLDLEGYALEAEGPHAGRLQFPSGTLAGQLALRMQGKADPKGKAWNLGLFRAPGGIRALGRGWSILEESVKARGGFSAGTSGTVNAVTECAREIVLRGPAAALPDIPLESVGNWRSADRQEIEGVRSVGNAMRNYLKDKNANTPLCIAVFGPPGAGKSFAIKEIAKELGIEKESQVTFNLSQLMSTDELTAAFHQVRDLNLKGRRPLVFFDEFDTPFEGKLLGWLRYFLAPMQDGEFTERGRVHPIGGGIFVFAGATRHSFAEFCKGASADELAAKKPDFISRLKAYIDVKGPNGQPNTVVDKLFIIRRAFLLNAFLEAFAKNIKGRDGFNIERAALDAYLRVNRYRHGARSMETLVKMSSLNGKRKYELSSLPPEQILNMHVNARDFLAITGYGHREMMRVGITGHIGLDPAHMDALKACIAEAIRFIQGQYPHRALTVFSPMALGADRLVARMLLAEEGAGLIAVLPMERQEYAADFGGTDDHNLRFVNAQAQRQEKCANAYADAEMRQEYDYWLDNRAIEVIELPPTPTRDEAYLQAGYFVAEHSDLLFAVWDGHPAQGTGGTGDVVEMALKSGRPVVHVWAGNYKENPARRTDVGEKWGTFRYKNIQGNADKWEE